MHTTDTAVAVLGAGPAGLVAARQLALAGVDVTVVDADTRAGAHIIESFPPSGAPLAEDIGLLQHLCSVSDGPARTMKMLWRSEAETRAFDGDGPLLLHRQQLHKRLRDAALFAGARLQQARVRRVDADRRPCVVKLERGALTAELVLDARGRFAHPRAASDLVALPFAATSDAEPQSMMLEALPSGWLWAASDLQRNVSGVYFAAARSFAGCDAEARRALISETLATTGLLPDASLQQVGRPMSAGLSVADDPVVHTRHILVGDAALARDPIASHGLVHALRSGVQAAVAAQTILCRDSDSNAAVAFIRYKHAQARRMAHQATDAAYRDQSKFDTSFWAGRAATKQPDDAPGPLQASAEVSLQLTRAPTLGPERILWSPAIWMPHDQEYFLSQGSISAIDLAAACRPAAPIAVICSRLARGNDPGLVADVVSRLWAGGAFDQASVAA